MSSGAQLTIHASQFPENVQRDLVESLRSRQVNHKFHYDSLKQTQKWLALHQAYSPSRRDPDCAGIYGRSFEAVVAQIKTEWVHVIGLGCGGGQKDARLLKLLQDSGREASYSPVDVSVAMVLAARQTALMVIPAERISLFVCDLATADDLAEEIERTCRPPARRGRSPSQASGRGRGRAGDAQSAYSRIITFFGMLPNFEPQIILPRLTGLVRQDDHLLLSANLAPGQEYDAGVRQILPLYDNALTRDWLMTFLFDLGVEKQDGTLQFVIEEEANGLKRVAAYFRFSRSCSISIEEQRFEFAAGESIRLFFSYRHTPELVSRLLAGCGLRVADQWITKSQEEGVFLASHLS